MGWQRVDICSKSPRWTPALIRKPGYCCKQPVSSFVLWTGNADIAVFVDKYSGATWSWRVKGACEPDSQGVNVRNVTFLAGVGSRATWE
jgi:hypothetical protein